MFRFRISYFLVTVVLFFLEVSIATIFKDFFFVRAYLGDVIVVILMYSFILSFLHIQNKKLLILGIFIFATCIEILQYLGIADLLKLRPGSIAHIVIGSSFSWWDILCYFIGCILLYIWTQKKDR